MTVKSDYSVLLRPLSQDDGGGWIAIVPDLPGCYSDGANAMEALNNVSGAIKDWMAAAQKYGRPIPKPDEFIEITFFQAIPPEMQKYADRLARQMEDLQVGHAPDPNLLAAIYAEMARTTIKKAHLT